MLLHSCFCNVNSLASLGQRRLSNSQASTSESVTSRLVSHAYSFAYEGFPSGFDTTQAVVKPIQGDLSFPPHDLMPGVARIRLSLILQLIGLDERTLRDPKERSLVTFVKGHLHLTASLLIRLCASSIDLW